MKFKEWLINACFFTGMALVCGSVLTLELDRRDRKKKFQRMQDAEMVQYLIATVPSNHVFEFTNVGPEITPQALEILETCRRAWTNGYWWGLARGDDLKIVPESNKMQFILSGFTNNPLPSQIKFK